MTDKPTAEQVAEARVLVQKAADVQCLVSMAERERLTAALRILIVATGMPTATPTDEELAEEALARFEDIRVNAMGMAPLSQEERASALSAYRGGVSNTVTPFAYVAAYIDGVGRWGRR